MNSRLLAREIFSISIQLYKLEYPKLSNIKASWWFRSWKLGSYYLVLRILVHRKTKKKRIKQKDDTLYDK